MYGAMVGVIGYSIHLNYTGELTVGHITSYLFYLIIILVNFAIFQSLIASLMQVSGAASKIIDFIDYKPLIMSRGGLKPESRSGEIEFKDVKFSYPTKKDVQILKGISFNVK